MLIAYHNDPGAKTGILKQLQAHADADEIVKGKSWEHGKGCAVGCTIHSADHVLYEPRFGIPQSLAHLEDAIFEGLPNGEAKQWPIRFMRAIPAGADLSLIQWLFLHWLLTDEAVNPGIHHPLVKDAVAQVATLVAAWAKGDPIDNSAADSARSAAYSAARSAAYSPAYSAARSAALSADSAFSADSAADSAYSAADSPAYSAAYVKMADKLIELLQAAPAAKACGV